MIEVFQKRTRIATFFALGIGFAFLLVLPIVTGPYYAHIFILLFLNVSLAGGYRLLFVPQAKVWHQGSASTAQNPSLRKYHLVKSTLYFLRKHAAKVWFPAAVVFWALVFLRAVIVEFWRGDLDSVRAYSRGLFQGWSQT